MSKLEELIQQYCPNGVKYYHLNDVATIKRGERVTKAQLIPDGQYPVISGGVKPLGYLSRYNREANTITIAQYGTAGYVDWQQNQFWANDVCYSVFSSKIINNRFLYFVLLHNQQLLYSLKTNAIPACLPLDKLAGVEIPVPPLPVQEEIVRILDNFTELQAELQAELQKRKLQYNYYLDNLLNFNGGYQEEKRNWLSELIKQYCPDGVNYKPLTKCCNILDGKRKPITKGARQSGSYPYYGANGIQDWVADYIFDGTYVLIGEDGSVITSNGTPIVNWAQGKIWVNNHAHIIAEKTGVLLRFLFYFIQTIDIHNLVHGNIPKLTQGDLKELEIPVPPLPVQEKIVRIMDKFSFLVNDLSSGLPAEIEKRRQQYEYYRDKLLTFKRKAA